jgi:hypothetical protein
MSNQETYAEDHLAAPDALWRRTPTPYCARYYLLGVPLDFATNSRALLRLAEEVFGWWRNAELRDQVEPVRLRVFLHQVHMTAKSDERAAFIHRAQEGYYFVSAGTSFGFCDREHGFATAFVTEELLRDEFLVKAAFIECLGDYMVSRHRPATLHAAGLVYNDKCVLVTGNSGAGKSTLAYAWVRAGYSILAEDIVHAEPNDGGVCVWGDPFTLHLLPDAPRFFPELSGLTTIDHPYAGRKYRLEAPESYPDRTVTRAHVGGVLSIRRSGTESSTILPGDPLELARSLTGFHNDPPLDREAIDSAVSKLMEGKIGRLEIGTDLEAGVEAIRRWLCE